MPPYSFEFLKASVPLTALKLAHSTVALWYFYRPLILLSLSDTSVALWFFSSTVALDRPLIFYQLFYRRVPHFFDPLRVTYAKTLNVPHFCDPRWDTYAKTLNVPHFWGTSVAKVEPDRSPIHGVYQIMQHKHIRNMNTSTHATHKQATWTQAHTQAAWTQTHVSNTPRKTTAIPSLFRDWLVPHTNVWITTLLKL